MGLNLEEIRKELAEKGHCLIDGCSQKDFVDLSEQLCQRFTHVVSKTYGEVSNADQYSSFVPPGNYILFAHNEDSYHPAPDNTPDLAMFFAEHAPKAVGGETTLIDGTRFLDAVPEPLNRKLHEKRVTYRGQWSAAKWKQAYRVDTVEALVALIQTIPDYEFRLEGDTLHYQYTKSALLETGGRLAFSNGILSHQPSLNHPRYQGLKVYVNPDNGTFWENGEPISEEDIHTLIDIQDRIAMPHSWKTGEIVVIDNRRMMHGRTRTEVGCKRSLLSRFGFLKEPLPSLRGNGQNMN